MTNKNHSYKKLMASAATAALVATAVAPAAVAADSKDFTDVNDRYKDAVDYVVSKGVNGLTATQFGVQKNIKRVDAAVFIANALDLNKAGAPDSGFTDVPKRAQQAVNALKDAKLINGKTATKFGSDDLITRGEASLILQKAYDLKGDANKVNFTDVSNRYLNAVSGMLEEGVTVGVSDTKFGTENPVKRGDLAVWLYKLKDHDTDIDGGGVTEKGITNAKAINDRRVEVTFADPVNKDMIREAERNGKYFVVYTEGNTVHSKDAKQSDRINFSSTGLTATFDLKAKDALESGKKYYIAFMDGDNKNVADVIYTYGPSELKDAADTPEISVSAVADKIYVEYSEKMKDSAKAVANYTVYDEGGKKLGDLKDFVEKGDGKWVNLNEKDEVEFKLSQDSTKKLLAGKTYKLVVSDKVKTDDNKTLAESERTIKIDTPSIEDASPEPAVARIVKNDTVEIVFDQDLKAGKVNLNPAQLDLRTSTGKTVDVKSVTGEVSKDRLNTLVIKLTGDKLDKGTTYNIDMPANVVQNGVFANAMNKSATGLKAEAQDNVSIASMDAKIVANAKNTAQADLILTFDQVPVINDELVKNIQLFEGRDEYKLKGASAKDAKVYGGDTSGKSIIIEDISRFHNTKEGNLVVRGDKSYDIEIKKGYVTTDSFDGTPAKNKEKLKAKTDGISVAAPKVDEVRLESAEKIEIDFKEDIAGEIKPSDLDITAFVANRSDIFDGSSAKTVSGSGYYDVEVSGKTVTITAKEGVKFPTDKESLDFKINKDTFTNADGNVGNKEISFGDVASGDIIDNAAPEIVGAVYVNNNTVELTYTENIVLEGNTKDIAGLFFIDGGENASEGKTYTKVGDNKAKVTFKEDYALKDDSTDLSEVFVEYSRGTTFYIQDKQNNKMQTNKITGIYKTGKNKPGTGGSTEEPADKELEAAKDALKDAIAEAEKPETTEGKTEDSVKALEDAIADANKVLEDKDSTKEDLDKAKADLEAAKDALKDKEETPEEVTELKPEDLNDFRVTVNPLLQVETVSFDANSDKLPQEWKDADTLTFVYKGEEKELKKSQTGKTFQFTYPKGTGLDLEDIKANAVIKK